MRFTCLFLLITGLTGFAHAETSIRHGFLATGRTTYIYEEPPPAPPSSASAEEKDAEPSPDRVFEDFERKTWAPWTVEGTAFGPGPVEIKKVPSYQGDINALDAFCVQSHNARASGGNVQKGDSHQGTITSPAFTIDFDAIRLRVGGGNHKGGTCVELLIDGKVAASITGDAHNKMRDRQFDVRKFRGKEAKLRVADRVSGGWGNISCDHIVFGSISEEIATEKGADLSGSTGVLWSYPHASRDGWVLGNGNVLLALGGSKKYPGGAVVEITRDGEMVFEYAGTQKEIQAVQPLASGRILCVEGGAKPRILELNRHTGKAAVEVPLQCQMGKVHMQTRMARKLPNGNYLAPHLLDFAVKEYDPSGKVVKVFSTDDQGRDKKSWPFTAIRLENGNTLVGCTYAARVIEFDPDGKIVWQIDNSDLPEPLIKDACGIQRLPNGNTVICSYAARGANEVKLLEVTRDKKVVWTHKTGNTHGVHHLQIISTNGKALSVAERSMK